MSKDWCCSTLSPGFRAVIYTVLTCALSWSFLGALAGGMSVPLWALPMILMWIPALVALVLRGALREGYADAGFVIGQGRFWSLAYLVPLLVATLTYATTAALGEIQIHPYLRE